MKVYTGIIEAEQQPLHTWPEEWAGYWEPVERDAKHYLKIVSFAPYFTQSIVNQLNTVFETPEEWELWRNSSDIVPTFLVVEPIPNHPLYPEFTRSATASEMPAINFKANELRIKLEIRSFDAAGIEQKQHFREVELIANNLVRIPLADGSERGEYDLLIAQMNSATPIEMIIRNSIRMRAADGWIDKKAGLL